MLVILRDVLHVWCLVVVLFFLVVEDNKVYEEVLGNSVIWCNEVDFDFLGGWVVF